MASRKDRKDRKDKASITCGLLAGDASEYDTFRKGAAAQTSCAMDAAAHLAGREQSRDRMTIEMHDLRIGIDLQTTRGVVHLGPEADGIKRGAGQRPRVLVKGFAKGIRAPFPDALVIRINRPLQPARRHVISRGEVGHRCKGLHPPMFETVGKTCGGKSGTIGIG